MKTNRLDRPDPEATPRLAYGSSVERGHAIPSGGVAAGALENGDAAEAFEDERDDYDELLDALGRTEQQDHRVALHELGHFLVHSLLGKSSISAVSINP